MRYVALLLALVACSPAVASPPPDIPPPLPIAPTNAADVDTCAHLAFVGCTGDSWPKGLTCIQAMVNARTLGIVIPDACAIAATTPAAVRACGDASTLTFACKGPQ